MKTSELTGAQLDWAVAQCEGKRPSLFIFQQTGKLAPEHNYSTNWAQAGPIIEREFIAVFSVETRPFSGQWAADKNKHRQIDSDEMGDKLYSFYMGSLSYGPTPLIAAMRCYVASKLGDEVDVPEELA